MIDLLLPGDFQVIVDAAEQGDETVDLCGMAETITSSALVALNSGEISRRVLPPASLARTDACTLLDDATVRNVAGPGQVTRIPSFADWRCDWDYTTGPTQVKVIFDRTSADSIGGALARVGRYPARIQPQGYSDTDCQVALIYRSYVDQAGTQTDETALVDLDDKDRRPRQLCAPAQRLATTVANRLAD